MKTTKKILSLALALMMVFSLSAVTAFAGDAPVLDASGAIEPITEPGTASSEVQLTAEAAAFDVTVPMILPVSIDNAGVVTTADNAKIENNSSGSVIVTDVEFTTKNEWIRDTYGADYSATPVNSKLIGFVINGCETDATNGLAFIQTAFPSIARDAELAIIYDATVAPQAAALDDVAVADVVFTIGWDSVAAPAVGD